MLWACDGVVMWWSIGLVLSKSYCGVSVLVIVRSSPDRVKLLTALLYVATYSGVRLKRCCSGAVVME